VVGRRSRLRPNLKCADAIPILRLFPDNKVTNAMGRTTRQLSRKRNKQKQRSGLQPGDMLQERYRIVGTLGVGGFSSVYQARDMRFPAVTKLCAVKEMVIATNDPQLRQLTIKSFEREASMLAMLNHPAIPDVSDYFTEGNRSYLVLELIRGKDLQNWLEEHEEMVTQQDAIEWALQLCDALGYLHTQKPQPIVFRDMKPSNVMLDQHNRIRLIDFGIAKNFEADNKGTMIGTEGYSPPEQYRGEATPAGDVYALGATLHHLLTRKDPRLEPPFTFAERPIRAVNPSVSAAFEAVVMRCLSYAPKERYADALALKEALLLVADNEQGIDDQIGDGPARSAKAVSEAAPREPVDENKTGSGTLLKPIWSFKCEDEIRSKAAVNGEQVYIGAYDNNLYALSRDSGEFRWKFPTSDGVGSSPCIYEDHVYIGSSDRHLYAINSRTGRMSWRFETGGPIYSSPSAYFDHIFFGSDDSNFYAVHATRGRLAWKTNVYTAVRSSPFVDEDRVFFGTEGGYIYCLEVSTGKIKWQFQAKRSVTSSPTVVDEMLVVGAIDNTVYALDASTGWAIWRFPTRRPVISSPVIHDGTIFVGSADGNLYAIDMDSGRQLWVFETEGQISSSPAIWEDTVCFGATDGFVYSLTTKKGEMRWRFKTGGPVISSPTIVDGVIYIGSTDHYIYALPV
jgi:eukaryotic-like serine/threonine-protein kinase